MFQTLLSPIKNWFKRDAQKVQERFVKLTTPIKAAPVVATLSDVVKTKKDFIAENALLQNPLIVLILSRLLR